MFLYEDQFSEEKDFPIVSKPSKVLIIASTARSGSHMLGHALYETNKFGFPLEYAQAKNLEEWKRRLGCDDIIGVMKELMRRRTSPNGVFGIKIHYSHLEQFGGFENLVKLFPDAYYILLNREDVLEQAVSLSIASQTGVLISGQKPIKEDPVYDFSHIDKCLKDTIINNSLWRYTLAGSGCRYSEMSFDKIRSDLPHAIKEISSFIDVEIDNNELTKEQATIKQSNQRNVEWATKFSKEFDKSKKLFNASNTERFNRVKKTIKRMIGLEYLR